MAEEDVKTTPEETTEATTTVADSPADQPVDQKPAVPRKKKAKRPVPHAQVHVLATFNNTIVTFTDQKGGALAAASAGACGFRGSKKGTAYAAQVAAEKAARAAQQQHGIQKVDVFTKGIGLGRDAAVRALQGLNISVESLTDVTGVPHGGCRPPKARRV